MIGDNDSLKKIYRDNFGTFVNRLDKNKGTREGFSTPRQPTFKPLEYKPQKQKRRDNIEEVCHTPVSQNRRASLTPDRSMQQQFWTQRPSEQKKQEPV